MEEALRSYLRLRPTGVNEVRSPHVKVEEDNVVSLPSRDGKSVLRHELDGIFDENTSQAELYAKAIEPTVRQFAQDGINATVMTYGQTGSGKSYTMIGGTTFCADGTLCQDAGLIPRAAHTLFSHLPAQSKVRCSFMQVYGDSQIIDLLAPSKNISPTVREHKDDKTGKTTIFVQNLAECNVACAEDILSLVTRGVPNRITRTTEANNSSSRSHAILQLSIEIELNSNDSRQEEHNPPVIRRAKLSLVDLAGSEKWSPAADTNAALASELKSINLSLSALGNCIAALAENSSSKSDIFVPFRDSTLTRLLQDSLSGGRRAIIISTASTALPLDETASTLAFALRAKRVKTQIHFDDIVDDASLLRRAQRQVARLRHRLLEDQTQNKQLQSQLEDRFLAAQAAATAALHLLRVSHSFSEISADKTVSQKIFTHFKTKDHTVDINREPEESPLRTETTSRIPQVSSRKGIDYVVNSEVELDTTKTALPYSLKSTSLSKNQTFDIDDELEAFFKPTETATIPVPQDLPFLKNVDIKRELEGSLETIDSASPPLDESTKIMKTITPNQTTPSAEAQATCNRHGLADCFLCALHSGSVPKLQIDDLTYTKVSPSEKPQDNDTTETRCTRHGLLSCFLCALVNEGISAEKLGIKPFKDEAHSIPVLTENIESTTSAHLKLTSFWRSSEDTKLHEFANEQPQCDDPSPDIVPKQQSHLPPVYALKGQRHKDFTEISTAYNHKRVSYQTKLHVPQTRESPKKWLKKAALRGHLPPNIKYDKCRKGAARAIRT